MNNTPIPQFKTEDEANQYTAQLGIVLSAADREKIKAPQKAELQRLKAIEPEQAHKGFLTRWVEGLNRFYPKLLDFLHYLGELVLTFLQTIIIAFGIPLVLYFLLRVEHSRILRGLELFEFDAELAQGLGH